MKLLVNSPTGAQEVVEVGEGGGYFDSARVLWDERTDGPMPTITIGGMIRVDGALEFSQPRMDDHQAAQAPPVPQEVTMRQARLALDASGLLDTVTAAVAAIVNPGQRRKAQIEWEYAAVVQRNSGLVPAMAVALGMTDAQIDDLFVLAETL